MSSFVAGLDAGDDFGLSLPPDALERMAIVLKAQGLYRDRDLYNYEVGPLFPGGNWTPKTHYGGRRNTAISNWKSYVSRSHASCLIFPTIRRHARQREDGPAHTIDEPLPARERLISNIGESLISRAIRRAPIAGRRLDVHCLVQLSHIQRLDALEQLCRLSRRWASRRSRRKFGAPNMDGRPAAVGSSKRSRRELHGFGANRLPAPLPIRGSASTSSALLRPGSASSASATRQSCSAARRSYARTSPTSR